MTKPRVFISFDFDNDQFLRDSLSGQSKNENIPFSIEDRSVKKPRNESERKEKCKEKLKQCDFVIVMCGEFTASCSGVIEEIRMATDLGLPIYGIKGYSDKICSQPKGLNGYYDWTRANLKYLTENYKKDVKPPFQWR